MRWMGLGVAIVAGCSAGTGEATGSEPGPLQWWMTCGDPVCQGYSGPFDGVSPCDTEVLGEACADEGARCDPRDDCNALVVCASEDPTAQTGGCPISAVAAKRELAYLDDAARERLLQDLLSVRLATWAYRQDAPGATRLGFVLEDHPPEAVLRPGGGQVDLYGYTSLVAGAVQAQQHRLDEQAVQIEALRSDLELLRARCGASDAATAPAASPLPAAEAASAR